MTEPFHFIAPARLPDPRDIDDPFTDGDTVWLQLDRHDRSKQDVDLRLTGVRAPDKKDGPTRDLARDYLIGWFQRHAGGKWPWLVETLRVRDESHEILSLARYTARVWCRECGSVLNDEVEAYYRLQGWPKGN